MHPTIKFTSSYNIAERSTNFLDLKITIKDNGIITDLYRKETDRVQYLLPSSCHPSHVFNNIPYSLALRLVRICSNKDTLLTRMDELKDMLLSRSYNKNVIASAIKRALEVKREDALKRVEKTKKKDRVTFVVTYNPKLPSISGIVNKHWKTLVRDRDAKEVFPLPPMVAYKQPPNLKLTLCKATLPQNSRSQRDLIGYKRCKNSCNVCSYSMSTRDFISKETISNEG